MAHTVTDEQIAQTVKAIRSMNANDDGLSIVARLLPVAVNEEIIRALKDERWKS